MSNEYKPTKQRKVILEELRNVTSHPTADELFEKVRKRLPKISLATVYRNLERFRQLGVIESIDGQLTRFDGNNHPHNHIKCVVCSRVDDLEMEIPIDCEAAKMSGYRLDGSTVEIHAVCAQCYGRISTEGKQGKNTH